MADAVQVWPLLLDDSAFCGQRLANRDAGIETVHAVEFGSGVGDSASGVHHRRHRQLVPQPDLEVVRIVGWRDFDCAGAEFGVDVFVGDDDQLTADDERVRQRLADEVAVAVVVGVHRDRGVAEHRLDPRGGHHDVRFGVVERTVGEQHQLALDVGVGDLEVRDRGLQRRRPVHQSLGPVDQPGVEEPLEDGPHRTGQAVVHGETVAAPVDTVAEPAHLRADRPARVVLPVPDLVDEQLAAEVFLRLAVDRQLLLHDGLSGNARVIHARKPQHLVALHPLSPGQRIHQGVIERMPHVQAAGDVRRRQHDRIRRPVTRRVRLEVAGVHPALIELAFHRARIPRLGQSVG